jgi:LysM domain
MRRSLFVAMIVGALTGGFVFTPPAQAFTGFSPVLHVDPAPDIYAGDTVKVWVTAQVWPVPMTVVIWFRSASHMWQSTATWSPACSCFFTENSLASIDHPDERVDVTARLVWGKHNQHQWWMTNRDSSALPDLRALVVHGVRIVPIPTGIPVTGGGGGSDYIVRPGDTLWSIARSLGVALTTLEAANPQIRNPNAIYVGEIIHLFIP